MSIEKPIPGTLLVIANASVARTVRYDVRGGAIELAVLNEYEHPQSREHISDLVVTKRGRNTHEAARGHSSAYEPNTDPKTEEHMRFAREIAEVLGRHHARGDYRALVLVSPPSFLGELRKRLSSPVERSVSLCISKDLTAITEHELDARIRRELTQAV